jgi:hypothetical protein
MASHVLAPAVMRKLWFVLSSFIDAPILRLASWHPVAFDLATGDLQFLRDLLHGKQAIANIGQPNVNQFFRRASSTVFFI